MLAADIFEKDRPVRALLGLLSTSLGCGSEVPLLRSLTGREWERLVDVSFEGGVSALSVDGYHKCLDSDAGDCLLETDEALDDLKFDWLGSVLEVEKDYRLKMRQTSRFAKALKARGIPCQVLKGISFSTYYNRPEHRKSGDCDVYLGAFWDVGNKVVAEIGGRYESGTYKHSHLFIGSLMIENHRYLTDFNGTRQGKRIERLLEKAIAAEQGREIGGTGLICPNDHFNALFLIRHAYGNFIYDGMILRMLYDWAALLMRCGARLDWTRLYEELEECRLRPFAEVMTSMCVEYLGVDVGSMPVTLCPDRALVDEIMQDTVAGGIIARCEETFLLKSLRIARRFKRIHHYRRLATESVPRMIWNSFAFSSYFKRKIEM